MKKLILLFAALIFYSCQKSIDVQKTIDADFSTIAAEHDNFVFYESQMKLNREPSSCTTLYPPHVVEMVNIFQVYKDSLDTDVIYIYHDADGSYEVEKIPHAFWIGDDPNCTPYISIEEAFKTMCTAQELVDSKCVTYRKVVSHNLFDNPTYIFGGNDQGKYIFVDAVADTIVYIKDSIEEASIKIETDTEDVTNTIE